TELAGRHRSELLVDAENRRTVQRHDLDRFGGGEAGFQQELVVALIAEARKRTADTRWIDTGSQKAAGFDERALERLRAPKQLRHRRLRGAGRGLAARAQILLARFRRERLEHAILERRAVRKRQLV